MTGAFDVPVGSAISSIFLSLLFFIFIFREGIKTVIEAAYPRWRSPLLLPPSCIINTRLFLRRKGPFLGPYPKQPSTCLPRQIWPPSLSSGAFVMSPADLNISWTSLSLSSFHPSTLQTPRRKSGRKQRKFCY